MVPERTVVLMKCPACAHPESRVIDSRPSSDGSSIRRRRECLHCQKRFTTYETIETVPITVVKKDKSRESFDRNKVLLQRLLRTSRRNIPKPDHRPHRRVKASLTQLGKL